VVILCGVFSFGLNSFVSAESDPDVTIKVNSTAPTNQNIIITIETSDNLSGIKEITLPDGTKVNEANTTYTVTQNGNYTFKVTDNAGNLTQGEVQITNIDKTLPALTLTPSTTSPTNQDITITAKATDVNGISKIILPDKTEVAKDTATFKVTGNGTFEFKAVDGVGNIVTKSITVSNIDKTLPGLTLTPSVTTPTNKDVTITAKATDDKGINKIVLPDGSEIKKDTATFTATQNGTFEFKAYDTAGNIVTKSIAVANIDKVAPTITVEDYNKAWTNKDITVKATTSDGILNAASHVFTENGEFTFTATDAVGNVATKVVKITNIDKVKPKMTITVGQ
jgi:hypothetical protein